MASRPRTATPGRQPAPRVQRPRREQPPQRADRQRDARRRGGTAAGGSRSSSAARKMPTPAVARSAGPRLRRAPVGAGRSSVRRPGSVSHTATGRNGSSATNTQRQLAWSASSPAAAGPTSDGSTQAVDISASMRAYITVG